jgi:hypothetical protein
MVISTGITSFLYKRNQSWKTGGRACAVTGDLLVDTFSIGEILQKSNMEISGILQMTATEIG